MSTNEAVLFDQPQYLDSLLVDHTEQLLALFGRDGRLLRANPSLAAFCAVPESELLGRIPWSAPWRDAFGLATDELRNAFDAAVRGRIGRLKGSTQRPPRSFDLTLKPVADRGARRAYIVLEGRIVATLEPPPTASAMHLVQAEPSSSAHLSNAPSTAADDTAAFGTSNGRPGVEDQDLWRAFFNTAPVGFFLLDSELRYSQVNEAMAAMHGCPAKDFPGRAANEMSPLLAGPIEQALDRHRAGKAGTFRKDLSGEDPVAPGPEPDTSGRMAAARRDGCTISLPLGRGGKPLGTLTVCVEDADDFGEEALRLLHDVADNISFALDLLHRESLRERTDAALRASEARLREAQAISKLGDWELERDTAKMSWSLQMYRLFERDVEQGPPDLNEALAYYTPESLARTRDCFWEVIDTGQTAELEQVVELPSGRTRYHATVIVPVSSPSGQVVKLYGTVQDITERKLAERELLRRTEEVEDLYQNAPCGYHSLDAEGRIIRINDTELRWLGYRREEVFGRMSAFDILNPKFHAAFEDDFAQLKRTGQSRVLELELARKDGSTLPVLASSTALFDADGNFVAARTMLADDTQRKTLERERAAYVARVAELSRRLVDVQENERRELASELHDRASPNLAALRITFANLADALPAPVLESVEPLLDDIHALLHDTTTGIREICTDLRPATLDYAGLIPALREYAAQFSRRTGIAVSIESDDFKSALLPNAQSLLFRIAQEALTNAAKHASAKKVAIRLDDSAALVRLSISDDGVGFDPQALGRPGSSPGLGLITMKERAEFAGGTFGVRSEPGAGTTITVVFDKNIPMLGRHSPACQHDADEAGLRTDAADLRPLPPTDYK